MSTISVLTQQLRGLRLNSMALALETLVAQAESSELSYLQFTDNLVSHEVNSRNQKRITLNPSFRT